VEGAAMSVLRIADLTRSFGSIIVTNRVNLTVENGERHVIIGPNGAGKTSLVNQIGGQLKPSGGGIFLVEDEITGLSPDQICRRGVARTFQRNNLFRELSVIENVRLAVQAKRGGSLNFFAPVTGFAELTEAALHAIEQVGLAAVATLPARSLSYGEQRQLEIAIALASEPKLLLLDEPTSGMAPAETARMIALIAGLPRSLAILMIEHDMQVVFSLADRITVLYYGEVLATGEPAAITANARVREVYLGTRH
jgi:branched-chain amino acid transport system ATP-binding protein